MTILWSIFLARKMYYEYVRNKMEIQVIELPSLMNYDK